ncbi:MAG: lipid-A-disaccharide synthase [Thermodesulfovibrionales bacterium]|nr:lipid-A-disaccharide synthase [Thermodesulfovibrionales bacterium]
MVQNSELKRVMIITGESSGELYGSLLAKELKAQNPELSVIGVGGERMEASGVHLISRISSAFGISEAVKTYSEIKRTFQKVTVSLRSFRPQVIVLIDYPDFNIRVAREAKKLGIKVLYYVSPQVWAWRRKRVKVIGRLVDRMAVILPFEEEIYKQHDIPCEFVGHPVLDEIREIISEVRSQKSEAGNLDIDRQETKIKVRKELGLISDRPVLALMPGSREHEIKKLLPVMFDAADSIRKRYPDYQFVLPIAPNLNNSSLSAINSELKRFDHLHLRIAGSSIKSLLASDVAVIASGTSTLQAAILGVPMVVVYKLSPLTYLAGRLIVKVRHISLVNILLERSIRDESGPRVKEMLQNDVNKENIMKELSRIIEDSAYNNMMRSQFEKVKGLFTDRRASFRVAEIIRGLGVSANV